MYPYPFPLWLDTDRCITLVLPCDYKRPERSLPSLQGCKNKACKVRPPKGQKIKKRTHIEMESMETTLLTIIFSQTDPDFINLINLKSLHADLSV